MRKITKILALFMFFSGMSISAQRFPADFFWHPWQIGPGWSDAVAHDGDTYDIVWEAHRGPLTIQLRFVGGQPVPPDENIDVFLDSLPSRVEYEKHRLDAYDDYLQQDYTVPFATGTIDGRRFHARADFPDMYGMLTVIFVPIDLEDEYMDEIRRILYP